jgi:predicted PurR-regulated permease PerM
VDDDRNRVLATGFAVRAARWGVVAWAAIGVLALAAILIRYAVYPIRIVFPPLIVAMIAVYLLNPVVTRLERRGLRRGWGTLIVYLVAAAVLGTALSFLVPLVARQVQAFVDDLPNIVSNTSAAVREFLATLGVAVGDGPASAIDPGSIEAFVGRFFSIARSIAELALIFVLGPILAFYLLVDLPKIKRALRALIPRRRHAEVETILRRIGEAIGGFFRGQLLVALFVGIASSIVLLIVGLPFWAVVGMIAGLFNLIPLVGPFIGTLVAIFVAFTSHEPPGGLLSLDSGWPLALGSAIALLVVQQIDNHILSPNIVGRTVRLHPVTVMLGLLVGGALFGLWGLLLAIPVVASVKILVLHAWDTRVTWPPPGEETAEPLRISPPPTPAPGSMPTRPAPEASSVGWRSSLSRLFGRRPEPTAPRRDRPREPAGERGSASPPV